MFVILKCKKTALYYAYYLKTTTAISLKQILSKFIGSEYLRTSYAFFFIPLLKPFYYLTLFVNSEI